jgi:carboxymethylenebutenolidase
VIFVTDGFGIRSGMWKMGQCLADGGYVVLQPDLHYRVGTYPPTNPRDVPAGLELMSALMKLGTAAPVGH